MQKIINMSQKTIQNIINIMPNMRQLRSWVRKKLNPKFNKVERLNFFILFIFTIPPKSGEKFFKQVIDFYHIWPLGQWIGSLVGLILLYLVTGYYYNKWLSDKGGWLDMKTRVWLILFDLSLNFALGLYYMNHRETILGSIMMRCPIAISPGIFLIELICFYFYSRYFRKS
jgi:hypothetical protein